MRLVFIETDFPDMSGIMLAKKLKELNQNLLIVFLSEKPERVRDAVEAKADYFLLKPFTQKTLDMVTRKMMLLACNESNKIYRIKFGDKVTVYHNGVPVPFSGKSREILRQIALKQGELVSNMEIYRALWPEREEDNNHMKVYYNALKRLKDYLNEKSMGDMIISSRCTHCLNLETCEIDA